MGETPISLENVPFTWGMAFMLDIAMGAILFAIIFRQNTPPWARAACCWIGWWAWASGFTLIINLVLGTNSPFSYHQIGLITESMMNFGFMWWLLKLTAKNWYLRPMDFRDIEELRMKLYSKNMKEDVLKSYEEYYKDDAERQVQRPDKTI